MKSEHHKHPKRGIFGRENDRGLRVVPCGVGEPVCRDESPDPEGPFCFIYTIVFQKFLLRLPLYHFERALLTEVNVAPAQLHLNSWAFVQAFSILCTHFGHPPLVEVFLYFFRLNALATSCGCPSTKSLGELCYPSSSNPTKASKASSAKSEAIRGIQPFWMGFPCTVPRNPDSKSLGV